MKKTSPPHEENFAQNNTINNTMNIKINKINKELYKYNSLSQIFQMEKMQKKKSKKSATLELRKRKFLIQKVIRICWLNF